MAVFKVDTSQIEKLQDAMIRYQSDTERAINEVLHNEAGPQIQEKIRLLMPVSGRSWRGKKPPAKVSKSMKEEPENLAINVKSSNAYHYLYFPDDGSNTRKHAGNQQFFRRGAELAQDDIVDRCVNKLTANFDKLI